MIVALGVILISICCILIAYHVRKMRKQNFTEYNTVEDLKRRIDELDEDNVEVESGKGTAKIIVPDIVDASESTRVSTQKEECKVYEVKPAENIEKTVIGSNKEEKDFVNTEIERVEDKEKEEDNNPIKEYNGIISKILDNNDDDE